MHGSAGIADVSTAKGLSVAFDAALAQVAFNAESAGLTPVWNQLSVTVDHDSDEVRSIADEGAVITTFHTLRVSVLGVT